jgi:thiamine kinase-like enzyme
VVEDGRFRKIKPAVINQLAGWVDSSPVLAAVEYMPGLSHADLSGDNVFVTPGGYKIIDWQYPRRLPEGYDLACLLESLDINPRKYVDLQIVNLLWFTRLAWFLECKVHLYPAGESYDSSVAELAERILEGR